MGCFTQPQAIKALTIYYEIISLLTYIIIDINIPVTCTLLPLGVLWEVLCSETLNKTLNCSPGLPFKPKSLSFRVSADTVESQNEIINETLNESLNENRKSNILADTLTFGPNV